jgi:hypothetical protein
MGGDGVVGGAILRALSLRGRQMLRPLLIGLAALLLAGPALAADGPGDPKAFVASFYAPAPETPASDDAEPAPEPEGPSVYAHSLKALMDIDAERDMNFLDFDWVTGGQDLPQIKGLKIAPLGRTDAAASYRVTFRNYGEARERIFYLVVEDGRWVIEDVELKAPERRRLSRILVENPQD